MLAALGRPHDGLFQREGKGPVSLSHSSNRKMLTTFRRGAKEKWYTHQMPQQCDRLPVVVNLHHLRTKATIITPGCIQANIYLQGTIRSSTITTYT